MDLGSQKKFPGIPIGTVPEMRAIPIGTRPTPARANWEPAKGAWGPIGKQKTLNRTQLAGWGPRLVGCQWGYQFTSQLGLNIYQMGDLVFRFWFSPNGRFGFPFPIPDILNGEFDFPDGLFDFPIIIS